MTTLNLKVSAGNHDCHQDEDGSDFNRTGTTQTCKSAVTAALRRWAGIIVEPAIPKGSTIDAATITGYLNSGASNNTLNSHVTIEAVDDAATFEANEDLVGRIFGSDIAWDFTGGAAGYSETSPELKTIFQTHVDRAGWVSGNRLCIAIKGDNATSVQAIWRTYENDPTEAFKVDITFTPPPGVDLEPGAPDVGGQTITLRAGVTAKLGVGSPDIGGQVATGSGGATAITAVGSPDVGGQVVDQGNRVIGVGSPDVGGQVVDQGNRVIGVGSPDVGGQAVGSRAGTTALLQVGSPEVDGQPVAGSAGATMALGTGSPEIDGKPVEVRLETPLELTLRHDGLAKLVALEIEAIDTAGAAVPLRASNGAGVTSQSGDDPDNAAFLSLLESWQITEVLGGEEDSIGGASSGNGFRATLVDDRREEASLEPWDSAIVKGRKIRVWSGSELTADGQPFPWSLFELSYVGYVVGLRKSQDSRQIECATSPREDRKVVRDTYRGSGGGVELVNAALNDEYLQKSSPTLDLTAKDYTLVLAFQIDTYRAGEHATIFQQNAAVRARLRSSDRLLEVFNANGAAVVSFQWTPTVGALTVAAIRWNAAAAELTLQVEGYTETVAYSDAVDTGGTSVTMGGSWSGKYWEAWVANSDLGQKTVAALIRGPLLYDRLTYPTILSAWKFETGIGTNVQDQGPNLDDLAITWLAAERWVSSLTGDDPQAHNTGIAGKTRQIASGHVFNAPALLLDTKAATYRWADQAAAALGSERLTQVRVEGAPVQVPWPFALYQILDFEAPDRVSIFLGDPASGFDGIGPFATLIAEEDGRPGSSVSFDYGYGPTKLFDAAAVIDLGGGSVRILSAAQGWSVSDKIVIRGTTNYDTAPFTFQVVTAVNPGVSFDISATYVAETMAGTEFSSLIQGSPNNHGNFEIAAVTDRGYAVRLIEQTITSQTFIATSFAVAGAALTVNAAARTFTPTSPFSGRVTCDFVGRAPTTVLAESPCAAYAFWRAVADRDEATKIEDVTPVAVSPVAALDEFWFQIGAAILAGEDREREDVLGRILDSGFMWARDDRDGGITIGQYTLRTPTGPIIQADTILELDRLAEIPRAYDLTVLWAKNRAPGGYAYPGSVPQAERLRLDSEWSRAQQLDPDILKNDRAARELEWPTALSFDYSATRLLGLLEQIFGRPIEWWRLVFDLPGHLLNVGDTRTLNHPTLGTTSVDFTLTALKHSSVLRGTQATGFLLR